MSSGSLAPLRGAAAAVAVISFMIGGLSIYFEAGPRVVTFWFVAAFIATVLAMLWPSGHDH